MRFNEAVAVVALMVASSGIAHASSRGLEDAVHARYGARQFGQIAISLPGRDAERFRIEIAPMSERQTVELERVSVRGAGFEVLLQAADGSLKPVRLPPVATYRGRVLEDPTVTVSAVLGAEGLRATAWRDERAVWRLVPARELLRGASRKRHVVVSGEAANLDVPLATLDADGLAFDADAGLAASASADAASRASLVTPSGPGCGIQRAELGIDVASGASGT